MGTAVWMTAIPEVVHAPVVELAALVDHSASSLLVLRNIQAGLNSVSFLQFIVGMKKVAPFCSG